MELFLAIFEFFITITISLIIAILLISILTWNPNKSIKNKENHWVLEIEEVETKTGKTYLIYNTLNDEFLYQVTNMDDLIPWLAEQLEKNKERTISVLDPNGVARALTLVSKQQVV
jgi:hypothetical protein